MDTKPSSHYHPRGLKWINGLLRRLNAMGLAKADLSEEALLAAARRYTKLERFGDEGFRPALRRLIEAIQSENRLHPLGRYGAKAAIIAPLMNRLWANANFEAHPEIRQRKIAAPIVIVGLARTGTTRLHRMLAADTRLQHIKAWEGNNPAPRIGRRNLGRSARYNEVKRLLHYGRRHNPGADSAHPMHVDWAEEEILLLNQAFVGFATLSIAQDPSYYNWLMDYDKSDGYRYMRELMQLISWSRGSDENQRWVLKTPQHMLDLPQLLKVFPDAKLVFTHRDPPKAVVSMMSLAWNFSVMITDQPCRATTRDMWLHICEEMARRCIKARESIPAEQQMDVYYHEMNQDWPGVMQRIYDFIGMEYTPLAQQQMRDWLAASERDNRHNRHSYSYADFGVTREEVERRMLFFRERYAIPYEGT